MTTTQKDPWLHKRQCNDECGCRSQLWHDVNAVVRRYNAPIPPQSASEIVHALACALCDEEDRDEEARS